MSKIKLLEIEGLNNGTRRFQSQLSVGKKSADFIMDPEGTMKCFGHGEEGMDFYLFSGEHEIVKEKSDLVFQVL